MYISDKQVIDSLEITVSSIPNLNLYLFELVQNSLDVHATHLRIEASGDSLSFEHNGASFGKELKHVAGLANVFQSSKVPQPLSP